ncbi:hypothetical protein N7456_005637 [Penicillium angulare]|uniref:Sulfatase N-terminal domain-containing protein n=1 Tax=Penicillium angulare TaxID=116970 RepID=A0A9W9KKR0_9EURO|nr:hypothetical protein N7456_005637 [Penicillium angulare]
MIISRQFSFRPFILALLIVSTFSSKALHLFQHATSLPQSRLILFFPTFFIQEAVLWTVACFVLYRLSGNKCLSVIGNVVTGIISALTFVLAASQIGFYMVTGSEVRWDAATSVGNDPEGRKLMLSGLKSFLAASTLLLFLSWLCTPGLSTILNHWLSALFPIRSTDKADEEALLATAKGAFRANSIIQFWTAGAVIITSFLWLVRPQVPYSHISGAIPFTFFGALGPKSASLQVAGDFDFPLQKLIGEEYWEAPNGHFKGWAPGTKPMSMNANSRPEWASGHLPAGFQRWNESKKEKSPNHDMRKNETSTIRYNPVHDPLRITNLDQNVVEPLAQALKNHEIPINHIVFVMMESARKDIFPFQAGSSLHQQILSSHESADAETIQKLNSTLSRLTPVAEKLTGEQSGFSSDGDEPQTVWSDGVKNGMGGINIHGLLTGSSLSFKSAIINHCGTGPLPVDFMDEVHEEIYQPCIMQILDLFNQRKGPLPQDQTKESSEFHDRNWTSIFLQSITGLFDDQNILNEQMGFHKALYKEQIENISAPYYHKDMEEINYFGYAERETYPYLRQIIDETIANGQRLFLSHFTSTTHHPWATPSKFHKEKYFADGLMGKHEDMNNYLNSVRYVDTWLGDILQVLDDTGISNETLVVLVGDHGQAFHEDSPVSGTYENGHISNFRIPLVFRHPLLPRIQITANATSMSLVPTLLDLLVQTKSLNEEDSDIAVDLMNEYEGQSLIRPYQAMYNGRQAWNFGIINAGGTMLSVGSAAVPYRLILPLSSDFEFVFSNLDTDPDEKSSLRAWSIDELSSRVENEHGDKAVQWVFDAEQVGRWWVEERKRLWNHH